MSKTKRRNIKKRNPRRKRSRSFTKSKSKSVNRLYRTRVNKRRRISSQSGGGVIFMGVDDKTGDHMYWSDYLGKMIKVAPLPSVPTKKSGDAIRVLEKQISRMPLAGIQDAHGLAPINVIEARKALLQIRAMPEPGKKTVPIDKKKELEEAKQITKLQAEFIERQQMEKDDIEVSKLFMSSDNTVSKSKKTSQYLLSSDDLIEALEPQKTSILPSTAESSLKPSTRPSAQQPSLKPSRTPSAVQPSLKPSSMALPTPTPTPSQQSKQPSQGAVARGRPKSPGKQVSLFSALQANVNRAVSDNINMRLTTVFKKLQTDVETQKIVRDCPPCLQHYILFRLEGQGITNEMIRILMTELEGGNGSQLRTLLEKHNLFPIPKSLWVDDSVCKRSAIGGEEFGVFTRRHHCRCCGRCITSEYYVTPLKVCTECDRLLTRM